MDDGSYGLCDVCHEAVEPERLFADPLARRCLDHLSSAELRELQRDLDPASSIQSAFLPEPDLAIEGWDFHTHYVPAGHVSDDYVDLIRPSEAGGEALVRFGDVSGKGVSASLLMSNLHAIFRSLSSVGQPLTELAENANRVVCEGTPSSSFATLVCGRAAPSGRVELINAGHWPPLLVTEGGVEGLPATGLPLGMFCSGCFCSSTVQLEEGDLLVLYTDGLSGAGDPAGEEYGADRIRAILARVWAAPPLQAA